MKTAALAISLMLAIGAAAAQSPAASDAPEPFRSAVQKAAAEAAKAGQ